MKLLNTILLGSTLVMTGTLYAQTDKEELAHAHNAIHAAKNCDDALQFLNKVSADGKTTAAYFITMANAHDCKTNYEQALYYYDKYLELQPKNDSVRKRVAELSDGKTHQARTANEERVSREMNGSASQPPKKKSKRNRNLLNNYFCIGFTYSVPTGWEDRPYNNGTGLNIGLGFANGNRKLVWDFASNTDFVYGQYMSWWKRAYQATAEDVKGAGFGITQDIEVSAMATIFNKKKMALMAGPMAGIKYAYTPDPIYTYNIAPVSTKGRSVLGPCFGAKMSFMFRNNGLFFIEYTGMLKNKFKTTNYPKGVDANHSMVRIGITLRGDFY